MDNALINFVFIPFFPYFIFIFFFEECTMLVINHLENILHLPPVLLIGFPAIPPTSAAMMINQKNRPNEFETGFAICSLKPPPGLVPSGERPDYGFRSPQSSRRIFTCTCILPYLFRKSIPTMDAKCKNRFKRNNAVPEKEVMNIWVV
jgi:hypothetical protein